MPGYHLPYFTAAANGIYARHGLDVELVEPFPGPENVRAVALGRYDFCLTSVAHFLHAKANDAAVPAKFVFMVARRTHLSAFALAERPAAHGREIRTVADLAGASVLGSHDSPFVREYLVVLRRIGIAPGPLIERPYAQVMEALAEGEGDVGVDYLDLLPAFEARARPHGARVRPLPLFQAQPELYGSGLVTRSALAESRPETVRSMVAAVRDALAATRDDPLAGLEPMRRRFPDLDSPRAVSGWRAGQAVVFADEDDQLGAMTVQGWQATIEHHAEAHGTPRLDPASVFDASFL